MSYVPAPKTEASHAVLNPAYYPRRYKPEALWSDAEKALAESAPDFEPEGRTWAGSISKDEVTYSASTKWS